MLKGQGSRSNWVTFGRRCGVLSGGTLLAGTVLYLLDALDLLGESPKLVSTGAGYEQDLADYYVSWFAHQRSVLWDVVARETALLVGFVGLALLALGAARRIGWTNPSAVVTAALFGVGAVLHVVSDFTFLGNADVWRSRGWSGVDRANMIAAGRAAEAVGGVSTAIEAASYLMLLGALLSLEIAARPFGKRAAALRAVALLEALAMVALIVGIAGQLDGLFQVGGLLAGVALGPGLALLLGRFVADGDREPAGVAAR